MQDAIRRVLGKYVTFTGRATRREFWLWTLAVFIFAFCTQIIDMTLIAPMLGFERFQPDAGQPLTLLLMLAIILPNLAVGIRRLHDTGRSGWWMLIAFIPLIGTLILLYFFVQASEEGENLYGAEDPL